MCCIIAKLRIKNYELRINVCFWATTMDRPYIDVYINNYELHIPN